MLTRPAEGLDIRRLFEGRPSHEAVAAFVADELGIARSDSGKRKSVGLVGIRQMEEKGGLG